MRPLNLFVVGAQKSATSALHYYLNLHPDISMTQKKELHIFDSPSFYTDYTNSKIETDFGIIYSGSKICGESTPIYMMTLLYIERLFNYNKNAKIIVSLRNPTERAFSHWKMEKTRNCENLDFSDAIRSGRTRFEVIDYKSDLSPSARRFSYVERGIYSIQLDNIFKFFQPQQVHLVNYKILNNNFQLEYNKILDFLKVDKLENTDFSKRIYPVKSISQYDNISESDRQYLNTIYASEFAYIFNRFNILL